MLEAVQTVILAALVIDRVLLGLRLQRMVKEMPKAQRMGIVRASVNAVQKAARNV
jgi:hypothetical protein